MDHIMKTRTPRDTVHHSETWVPTIARLDIPLRSVVNLRRVAGNLRALAQQLDFLSRADGDSADLLCAARNEVRHTNRELAKIKRVGRPRKEWNKLQWDPNGKHNI